MIALRPRPDRADTFQLVVAAMAPAPDELSAPGAVTYNSDTMIVGDGTWDFSKNDFLLPNLVGFNFDTMQYNGQSFLCTRGENRERDRERERETERERDRERERQRETERKREREKISKGITVSDITL